MKSLKTIIKNKIPVSWRNPFISLVVKIIDPLDYLVRVSTGFKDLPNYSIRIRSNGMKNQFGGRNFNKLGELLLNILKVNAEIKQDSKILEIGCGCGRTAIPISKYLITGTYDGMDIDKKSLNACLDNFLLKKGNIHFKFVDIYNNEYNPNGKTLANNYVFPYENESFDTIFLISVFTHMLTNDVLNYIKEISRLLKPGGVCMISTFLMEYKSTSNNFFKFKYKSAEHYYDNEIMPEVAIGYTYDFYVEQFKKHGIKAHLNPQLGGWRNDSSSELSSGFSQDIVFFKK